LNLYVQEKEGNFGRETTATPVFLNM